MPEFNQNVAKICFVKECPTEVRYSSTGLCGKHYQRNRKFDDPLALGKIFYDGCFVEGCDKPHKGKGYCAKHLWRFEKNGSPFVVRRNNGEGETQEIRFWTRVAITANPDKCWEWQGNSHGYGYGNLQIKGKQTTSHVAAWYYFYGYWPAQWILHSCDNAKCCNPHHLREGTPLENSRDMIARRRGYMGERHYMTHFSIADVLQIRKRLADGESQKVLAQEFHVAAVTISGIWTRRNWKHI